MNKTITAFTLLALTWYDRTQCFTLSSVKEGIMIKHCGVMAFLVWGIIYAAPSPVSFNAPLAYFPGYTPQSIAVADFNGDGISDVAVAIYSYYSGTVAVMLGNGNGTLQPAVNYTVADGASAVAIADFNGDGKLDIAVADFSGITILFGNGDGTFQPATPHFNIQYVPQFIATGDFNGDGKEDVAVVSAQSNNVSVMLGNGDGTFRSQVTYPAGTYPLEVAISDLNGDGHQDLVVAANGSNGINGSISILLGKGDGTFDPAFAYTAGRGPSSVSIGDFNEDGIPDLAVALSISVQNKYPSVVILLGKGDGTFLQPLGFRAGEEPSWVVIGDFNDDGHIDLAVADYATGNTTILLGFGNGTFDTEGSYSPGGNLVATGMFNPNGVLDLVVLSGAEMCILRGDRKGGFHGISNFGAGKSPQSVAAGKFTTHSSLDLIIANTQSNTVSVLLGNGNGVFQRQVTYSAGSYPYSVSTGDFNGDGKLDIVVAGTSIEILLGNGDGTFQPAISYPGPILNSPDVIVADFNRDGRPDLAVTSSGTVSIMLGNGNATFQPPVTYTTNTGSGKMAAADFNGDGKPDIAVATNTGIVVLLGNGDGTFKLVVTSLFDTADYVTAGDFNADGKLDLVVSTTFPVAATLMLLGNGDGSFQSPVSYPGIGGALVAGDFNGDGKLDVAGAAVAVMPGNGDGTFGAPVNFAVGLGTGGALAMADFNHDGKPDIAVPNMNLSLVSILLNTPR